MTEGGGDRRYEVRTIHCIFVLPVSIFPGIVRGPLSDSCPQHL